MFIVMDVFNTKIEVQKWKETLQVVESSLDQKSLRYWFVSESYCEREENVK